MTYIFISIQYLFSQRKKFQKLKVKECKKLHNIKGFLCSVGKIIVTSQNRINFLKKKKITFSMSNVMVMQYDSLNRSEKYASQYIRDDDYRNN